MIEGATGTPEPPASTPPYCHRGPRSCNCPRCRIRSLLAPVILVTLGVLFLSPELFHRLSFSDLWPILLIVIGLMKLLESTASVEGHQG